MKNKTRFITTIAIMSALSFVFYALEFSVGFIFTSAPFLKLDPSDLPCILTSLALSPKAGIIVAFVKNLLHIFISRDPSFSGEIANFSYCLTFLIPLFFYKKRSNKLPVVFIFSIVFSTLAMCVINYFVTLPLYGITNKTKLIIEAFIPFNILKGILLSVITIIIIPKITKLVEKD